MALYAFDGTWNEAKETEDPKYRNTNVYRFYEAYRKHSHTDDFYVQGVGTRFDKIGRIVGGLFGLGELPRISEAYDHLCKAWADGDHIIDIVGFSRGAATTLDFCHHILEKGIRRPGTDDVVVPVPEIRFLGVWDIVAAFGLANLGNNALNFGHHLSLPRASLRYAFHAMALDERRPSFLPTRLPGAYEVWFRGVHSDIGGGNTNKGLNDITLKWMFSKAKAASLPIADEDIAALQPDPTAAPHPDHKLPLPVRVIAAVDRRHYSISPLDGWTTPPDTCPVETTALELQAAELGAQGLEVLPRDVYLRILALWETAQDVAKQNGFDVEPVKDDLLTLFQGRIPLVTNAEDVKRARVGVANLIVTMIEGARSRGSNTLNGFFLTEALFKLPHQFPLTD